MHGNRYVFLLSLVYACMSTSAAAPVTLAAKVADPLDRPAQRSVRSSESLLTAVTRAGPRLVAVGERGVILLSDDSGAHWRQARMVPVGILLTGVGFSSPSKGWAVGHSGVVLRTLDGGETWLKQLDGRALGQLALQHVGTIGTEESLAKQRAEAQRLVTDGADKPFLDVLVEDDLSAIAVGAFGLAFRTADGGKTWAPWHSAMLTGKGSHLYAIRKAGKTLYVAGEQGTLFRSDDSGETLAQVEMPYKGSYFGLALLSSDRLLAYGLRGNAFVSGDAGVSWNVVPIRTPASLTASLVQPSGTVLLANQAGAVLKSQDGGISFAPLATASPWPVVSMASAPDGSVVVVGMRGALRLAANATAQKDEKK
jgi:photosystem II stability/assembly factor-like uncharacterized protein